MTWTDAGISFIYNIYINIYNIYINISLNQFVLKRLKDMVHRNLDRSRGNAVFGECHGVRRKFRQRFNYCTVRMIYRNRRAVSGWASGLRRAGADAGAASWLQLHAQMQARRSGCRCMRRCRRGDLVADACADAGVASWLQMHAQMQAWRAGCIRAVRCAAREAMQCADAGAVSWF